MEFDLRSKFAPAGDQVTAIKSLVDGINNKEKYQVLLGVTGSGKTFTIANVIEQTKKKTLVLAHNKTLAGQLYSEFKQLFPNNRVEYFVSYYDYYQPEAYVPSSDTYIEKDASINEEIDELRHSATASLLNNDDVIVVASVSCIYGIGEVEEYRKKTLTVSLKDTAERDEVLDKLVDMYYERSTFDLKRGGFRAKGDTIEIIPAYEKSRALRIEFFGDTVDRISEFDPVTGEVYKNKKSITLFPASHFVTSKEKIDQAIVRIEEELDERLKILTKENKLIEKQRLKERCRYDIEMLKETGFCNGVENYARHLALREAGATPSTLIDFFGDDFLLVIDESHVSVPQVRAMYAGDQARKGMLVDYGFRLPSAKDNRPLMFDEFEKKLDQVIYVSATPGDFEVEKTNGKTIQQIIRPTGLLDPEIIIKPTNGQIDDLIIEINKRIELNERVLITTLTIKMAEELTNYLNGIDYKVAYLHSKVKTLDRMKTIRDLRVGKYDVLIGINLLREGIDIPEVSLVAIMDADKQGFLRSSRSLIQTIGRAARNSNGKVHLYADKISPAMEVAISETSRRREIQEAYNTKNNITPTTIVKDISDTISNVDKFIDTKVKHTKQEKVEIIEQLEEEMRKAAKKYDFERAAEFRDLIFELKLK